MASELTEQLDKAKALVQDHRHSEAINTLRSVINHKGDLTSDVVLKAKEKAVIRLGKVFVQLKQPLELAALLRSLHPFFATIPKAKTAKLVRSLIDLLTEIPGTDNLITELCTEYIAWANEENRTVLRQRLEFKLAHSWYKTNQFKSALDLISKLNREVKRLDDKPMMVEVHLLESKIHHGLFNLSKARACLTAARTVANAIYCPPTLQADLDTVSGTLHSDEKDYKTAYSYFFEAFENYNHSVKERTVELHTSSDTGIPSPENLANQMSFKERTYLELSVKCLKYMLMCKIMSNVKEDVSALIGGKLALRYGTIELEAMRALAAAHAASSLKNFQHAMSKYETEIRADPFLNRHLNSLYDTLLEQNLLKLIEPFSQVQVTHIAHLIELPADSIERKLSQMILDKKLSGILDQGANCLIIFDNPEVDSTYSSTLSTIAEMGKVVDSLYNKASKLS